MVGLYHFFFYILQKNGFFVPKIRGKELKKFHYTNIDGADLSRKLLNLVPKGIYNKLEQIDLNKPLIGKCSICFCRQINI